MELGPGPSHVDEWTQSLVSERSLAPSTGFTNKYLRALIAARQMNYDLRRRRRNSLIRRVQHTNRYTLTEDGIRIAIF